MSNLMRIVRNRAIFLCSIVLVFLTSPAVGQSVMCGERDKIVEQLADGWQEQRTAIGIASNGGVVEVFSSPAGTWTMLLTLPGRPTCMIGSGDGWEQQPVAVADIQA